VDRKLHEDEANPGTGPGYYNVYDSRKSVAKDIIFDDVPREKKVNVFATSDRILNNIEKINFKKDLEFFPLREKLRIQRQVAEMRRKFPQLIELKTKDFKDYVPPSRFPITDPHIPSFTFGDQDRHGGKSKDRFASSTNKPEAYVKTTGMILSQNFDKSFDKRIQFQFSRNAPEKSPFVAATEDGASARPKLDVDKYYSTAATVMQSPISYGAIFR